eukprot:CAMPEP_0118826838 /NCGR_PEP_ID=MMETSP1162-20130426/12233_1 /TAXON_ID=33656 /ORGANISM="Phaeocystis Sp, Strain CCMP2710" /LENGTH=116 /DNA_ID=CAMNT_0006757583 /DNA_START=17 /DNA_END=364 /DNA_ORIENTATION=-
MSGARRSTSAGTSRHASPPAHMYIPGVTSASAAIAATASTRSEKTEPRSEAQPESDAQPEPASEAASDAQEEPKCTRGVMGERSSRHDSAFISCSASPERTRGNTDEELQEMNAES